MADTRARRRLDQPRSGRRFAVDIDPETFGRFSESLARFMGTGTFLFWQTLLVITWITLNIVAVNYRWDPYPFILLNLAFSTQAAYAAPLILLAQNRQDDRDRANLAQDREQNLRQREDTEYLAREVAAMRIALSDLVTRDFLRAELRSALVELGAEEPGRRRRRRDEERQKAKSRRG